MKSHIITSIIVFIAGAAVSFVAGNIIIPSVKDFSIKTINIDSSASLEEPNIEIFNYRAINPTVEVYVGENCEEYDENGNCVVIGPSDEENTNPEENINPEENTENSGENENGTTN